MQSHSDITDNDLELFSNTVPPPPYPGLRQTPSGVMNSEAADYDLTPIPHNLNRPRLPEEKRNPHLQSLPEDVTLVKFQTIVRDNREIVVGRIKVPTGLGNNSNNHAFILRRYDTNAISLTTMYKVAFPGATEEDERREMDWVKSSFDTRNTNGGRTSETVRLAGQWVSRHLAIHLAPAYHIEELVAALARAAPDPNVAYRKSQRSQLAADQMARQREAPTVPVIGTDSATPIPKRQRRSSPDSPVQAVESEQRHLTLEATTTLTAPSNAQVDVEAEIQSAKQLVLDLKRELRLRAAAGEELEDQGVDAGETSRGVKRGQGDESVTLSSGSDNERIIKRNKRIEQGAAGDTAKKLAWGALLFGLGVGATFLPNLL